MSKQKKNSHKNPSLEKIVLATVLIELMKAIVELISKLLE